MEKVISQDFILMPVQHSVANCIEDCSLPHPRFQKKRCTQSSFFQKRHALFSCSLAMTAVNSLCGMRWFQRHMKAASHTQTAPLRTKQKDTLHLFSLHFTTKTTAKSSSNYSTYAVHSSTSENICRLSLIHI